MATRYNPRLIVRLGGVTIATSDDPAAPPALLAIDKLSASWGRSRISDHQSPAQASLSVIDRTFTYGPHNGYQLLNLPVTLSYDVPGIIAERTFFRGVISEAKATVLPPDPRTGANRGMRIDLAATSIMANLARVLTGVVSYPAEQYNTRWARFRNMILPAYISGGGFFNTAAVDAFGNTLNWALRGVVARTYQNVSVLDALKELLDMTGDQLTYNPHTNGLATTGRKVIDDPAGYAYLTSDPDGLVLKAPGYPSAVMLDGGEFSTSELVRSNSGTVTAVQTTRYTDSTGATQVDGALLGIDSADATQPDRMTVNTDWYSSVDSGQTAIIWSSLLSLEGKRWVPDPITHQTKRLGGLTAGQISLLLAGQEPTDYVYVSRTDWARAQAAPIFSIIGGTIAYQGGNPGWWQPTIQLTSVYFRNSAAGLGSARTAANCDPGAAHPIKAADLSPGISAADARFWTAAYTG